MTHAAEPSAFRFLSTRRLALRAPVARDVPAICRMLNDPEIAERLGSVCFPYAPRWGWQWLSRAGRNRKGHFYAPFLLAFRSNPRLFAGVAFVNLRHERSVEIGYWVARQYRRRGYASEAARALTAFIFASSPVTSVLACAGPANRGSHRVLRRIGMHRVGRGRIRSEQHRRYMPVIIFRMTRKDWQRAMGAREEEACLSPNFD